MEEFGQKSVTQSITMLYNLCPDVAGSEITVAFEAPGTRIRRVHHPMMSHGYHDDDDVIC